MSALNPIADFPSKLNLGPLSAISRSRGLAALLVPSTTASAAFSAPAASFHCRTTSTTRGVDAVAVRRGPGQSCGPRRSFQELGTRPGSYSNFVPRRCRGKFELSNQQSGKLRPNVRAASIPLSSICFERVGLGSARASCRAPIITAKIPMAVRLLLVASPLGRYAPISSRRRSNLAIKARRVETGCRAISATNAAAAQPPSGLSRRPGVR